MFFEILVGLYDIVLWLNQYGIYIEFFYLKNMSNYYFQFFLCMPISYINVEIIRSKFKNNKNFTFSYPPYNKIRILKMKVVFSSLIVNTTRKYELSTFRNKKKVYYYYYFWSMFWKFYFFWKIKKVSGSVIIDNIQ